MDHINVIRMRHVTILMVRTIASVTLVTLGMVLTAMTYKSARVVMNVTRMPTVLRLMDLTCAYAIVGTQAMVTIVQVS